MKLGNTLKKPPTRTPGRAHVLVIGNEKGGSGKSTTAMHIAVALLYDRAKVGLVDVDWRQASLSRYLENRTKFAASAKSRLPVPSYAVVMGSAEDSRAAGAADEKGRFEQALKPLLASCDYVIIDTPGSDTHLSRLAHVEADTLLTPLNDSFVDLDILGQFDAETMKMQKPSIYSDAVWRQRQVRAAGGRRPVDWVVARNRLSHLNARNKQDMQKALAALAQRLGFRIAPGQSERVIYRELFLKGLTLHDLRRPDAGVELTLSHLAARQELRNLMAELNLPAPESAAAAKPAK